MTPRRFIETLQSMSFENTFNPYSERCPVYDVENAPELRREALLAILKVAANSEIDAIWIGRDLGHRGGRRTGLALTDDVHSQIHAERWGTKLDRPTIGQPIAERTAAVIWSLLQQIETPVFLWNVFPLHPHEEADPFSNRSHNSIERQAGEELLFSLIRLLRPKRLIAIGNDAAKTARRLESKINIIQVRHPSYGGQNQFLSEIRYEYGLEVQEMQPQLQF